MYTNSFARHFANEPLHRLLQVAIRLLAARLTFVPLALLVVAAPIAAMASEGDNREPLRVLAIGNSFTDNALTYLPKLATASGHKLIIGRALLGDTSLKKHWSHVEANTLDPTAKTGRPYRGKQSLQDLLVSEAWDIVVIQQVSWKSFDADSYQPWAGNLKTFIKEHAPQARVVMHQTWAYRKDDPWFGPANKGAWPQTQPKTQQSMYEQLRAAYQQAADQLQIDIIPSGDAFYRAGNDPQFGYQIDPNYNFGNPVHAELPDQSYSLHTGWHWIKRYGGGFKLRNDGHHASRAGKYLAGCVWYQFLFDEDVTKNTYIPANLDPAHAAFLREVAQQTVQAAQTAR